jgi:hypothetical protein
MENGLAIIEFTEAEVKGVHIDQEALEFARLNALTKKRRDQIEACQRREERNRSRAERMKQKRRAYNIRSFWYVASRLGIAGAVAWAGTAGMVAPGIWIPVTLFAVSAACVRFWAWLGRCFADG